VDTVRREDGDEKAAKVLLALHDDVIRKTFDPDGVLDLKAVAGKWVEGELALILNCIPEPLLTNYYATGDNQLISSFLHNLARNGAVDMISIVSEAWFVVRAVGDADDCVLPSKSPDRAEIILNYVESPNGRWSRNLEIVRGEGEVKLVESEKFAGVGSGRLAGFWPRGGAVH